MQRNVTDYLSDIAYYFLGRHDVASAEPFNQEHIDALFTAIEELKKNQKESWVKTGLEAIKELFGEDAIEKLRRIQDEVKTEQRLTPRYHHLTRKKRK